jgi:hypothetical protein
MNHRAITKTRLATAIRSTGLKGSNGKNEMIAQNVVFDQLILRPYDEQCLAAVWLKVNQGTRFQISKGMVFSTPILCYLCSETRSVGCAVTGVFVGTCELP